MSGLHCMNLMIWPECEHAPIHDRVVRPYASMLNYRRAAWLDGSIQDQDRLQQLLPSSDRAALPGDPSLDPDLAITFWQVPNNETWKLWMIVLVARRVPLAYVSHPAHVRLSFQRKGPLFPFLFLVKILSKFTILGKFTSKRYKVKKNIR
jgi:hypothetical protein